jgi:hypothetical protein
MLNFKWRHFEKEIILLISESLPRDRFWDIQVPKIDSQTRQPNMPQFVLVNCNFELPRWAASTLQFSQMT